MDHHDYRPGCAVEVEIEDLAGDASWHAAIFLGTRVGIQYYNCTFLVVETEDGHVWDTCSPECVRGVTPDAGRDSISVRVVEAFGRATNEVSDGE